MRPYKTFLVFLVLMVLLFGPSYFVSEPLRIAPGISVSWPELSQEFSLWSASEPGRDTLARVAADSIRVAGRDTAAGINDGSHHDVAADSSRVSGRLAGGFLYDFSDYKSLSAGLGNIIRVGTDRCRIMYYGDSQLEGDRITDHLRRELRKTSGGSGPGLLSAMPLVPYTRTTHIKNSPGWERYDYLAYVNGRIGHRSLGPVMSISRFSGRQDGGKAEKTAWLSVEPSRFADSLSSVYDNLRLFYGSLDDTLLINVITDEGLVHSDSLLPVSQESEYSVSLGAADYLKLEFTGRSSPDIYGLSLESDSGVIIDNIPGRGSAGLEFTMLSRDNLDRMYGMLEPDMIILHYGLNVVLNISSDYKYYENGLYSQVKRLQDLCPDASIMLVGLTDMAHRDGDKIISYKNIPLIRDAQKRAAERAGILFWDAWEAMGGENSILEWSRRSPALAASDYTHLTYAGGEELAKLMIRDMLRPLSGWQQPGSIRSGDTLMRKAAGQGDTAAALMSKAATQNDTAAADTLLRKTAQSDTGSGIPLKQILSYNHGKPLLFTGSSFWILLFFGLMIYSMVYKKPLIRNTYLFLFSLFFYYKSGGIFFFLLIISTLADYAAGLLIYSSRRKSVKRLFVFFSLLVNLGMLSYFKYTGFFTGIVNDIFNTDLPVIDWVAALSNFYLGTGFNIESIVLPVGISFFTFQTISYTMDVYRGKTEPVRNILDFGFYVSFFPQLVAGPIVRASEFIPQLYAPFRLSVREWGHALFLVVSGLIKKMIISDLISVNFVDRVFETPLMYSGIENLMAIYGYGLQIYCDFSGYTDIAIGIALMLGYRLPLNFNSPYKAHNITDFWRRWHISLSRWLKDYLYISMGGNRKGRIRTYINIMITMLLGGLWHGAAWRFVIWGGLHGAGLVINKLWTQLFPRRRQPGRIKRFISVLITFNFVSFCWIFFRAPGIDSAGLMLRQVFTSFSPGSLVDLFTSYSQVIVIMVSGYILHFLPVRVKEAYRGLFIRLPLAVKILLVYLVALVLYNVQSTDIQPFIYFRF